MTLARQRKKRSNTTKQTANGNSSVDSKVPTEGQSTKPTDHRHGPRSQKKGSQKESTGASESASSPSFWPIVNGIVGVMFMLVLAYRYSHHISTLHENNLWFSNIQEVEREISFRTESGLYYSYYKQMVNAPSLSEGLYELVNDNKTEHLRTINILARFNIYQEVLLSAMYRTLPFLQSWYEPVYWYINSVFNLHAMLVCALYITTWLMSSSWLAGLLAVLFYILNKEDTTRVSYVIPLRESFSLPFLWLQLAIVTYYFRPTLSKAKERLCVVGLLISTFCFSITWQFNQFIILLQAMALFGTQVLQLVPNHKVVSMYFVQLTSLVAVCVFQFGNTMILCGFVFSFIPAALIVMSIQSKFGYTQGLVKRGFVTSLCIILVFLLAGVFMTAIKFVVRQEADEHIYRFVLTKFGLATHRDFDVQLYVCNGAFKFLDVGVLSRLTANLVFPVYAVFHAGGLIALVVAFCQQARQKQWALEHHKKTDDPETTCHTASHLFVKRPELAYHFIQVVFFGAMAVTTLRMKYLWTPYMCILAAVFVGDFAMWRWILEKCQARSRLTVEFMRHGLTLGTVAILLCLCLPAVLNELEELREFYDPDTVDLMNWIKASTPPNAAFAGSMQLLAGVKLCTGRPLTNHPHYEDKVLRQRTKELYQMYAKRSPEDVSKILHVYNASYIILEDSICLTPFRDGCGLPAQMDMDNGIMPIGAPRGDVLTKGLIESRIPRFCDEIRRGSKEYIKYFKLVFSNKTFRVYKVL